ncbi:hypothetical protein BVI1335_540009 [Burkholderia vietnamiensis]|nr:hypothetical protein BVI1335_540009 [Burkholderia vietnamiensis]
MYSSSLGMFLFKEPPMAEPAVKFRRSVLRYVDRQTGAARSAMSTGGYAIVERCGRGTRRAVRRARTRDDRSMATSSPPVAAPRTGTAWRE